MRTLTSRTPIWATVTSKSGYIKEAIVELQKAADLTNHSPAQMVWLAQAWALAGRNTDARLRAGLEEFAEPGQVPVLPMALQDLALGERRRALARLKAACSAHTSKPFCRRRFSTLFEQIPVSPT